MKLLPFTNELSLPIDAATQTFGDLGKKGSGKTYGASRRFELLYGAGVQCVVLDPVGNWYGLRLGRDGKSPGLPVPVFGGAKGDIPLEPTAGAFIARVVVEQSLSVILDVSRFRKGERKRFITDFAEEFFHLKKDAASPVHLFLDEAHFFVPQKVQKGEERMLGAMEDIVRVGRNYGIGVTLVSQRAASVNKDVLTQVECLVAYQTSSAQDKKAIREWVEENDDAGVALLGELKSLEQGDAILWSPSWLRKFLRVHITQKDTFDASATPKVGEAKRQAKALAPVDLEKIRVAMQESIERQKENDPTELKKKVKELQAKLDVAILQGVREKVKEKRVEIQVLAPKTITDLEKLLASLRNIGDQTIAAANNMTQALEHARHLQPRPVAAEKAVAPAPKLLERTAKMREAPAGDVKLKAGARQILHFLSMWNPKGLTRSQIATMTGIKSRGSTFSNYLSSLRVGGFIREQGDLIFVTDEGLGASGDSETVIPTTAYLVSFWGSRIKKAGARTILETLVSAYPQSVSRAALADILGIEVAGSTLSNYISLLRTNDLLNDAPLGDVVASDTLFPT
jgi:hypothetical protein